LSRIVQQFAPRRIYQWGALLRPGAFKPYSDIDIAIEGVTDAERFIALLGEAQALSRFPLDIVQMEKIAPEYADEIGRTG
jgi:predicted nucleotidyltransferase